VVLCSANGSPDFRLPAQTIQPAAREHLIREPYADYRMATIAPDDRVLLLGTGLTMVDQVIALDRADTSPRSPQSRGTAFSRRRTWVSEPNR